ncbi:hypothetical protein DAPPUDRAFT_319693 [Daphnia pulex]|uniref:Uncharacterized protein n=1 Tax=Daphnia pulex TaxID=6669 RepID=E9GMI6_DAPPU|nr:hypothetical protein DAPPUDRAFT_319693 [Daphnia pulex]|eukprot:EFX79382.1 hypothetical protein DAPPUDRAFT_319693 [Daphnia pulex]
MLLIENHDFMQITHLMEKYPSADERDSQGYTLLKWAETFSKKDVTNYLEKKGAFRSESFRQNVFFIALRYLDSQDELNDPKLTFDGIDVAGANQTGDTALHLALYGGKWKTAKKILE